METWRCTVKPRYLPPLPVKPPNLHFAMHGHGTDFLQCILPLSCHPRRLPSSRLGRLQTLPDQRNLTSINQSINQSIYKICNAHSGRRIESNLRCRQSPGGLRSQWGGYTLPVVREVRWVFSRRLKVSNVFDSPIMVGNSFEIVGAE